MPEYTVAVLVAVAGVVALEYRVLRTGLFHQRVYWVSMAIVFCFQVLVNGWLSRLSAPTFLYHPDAILGARFPWDIPVEDLAYGWALVTVSIALWLHAGDRPSPGGAPLGDSVGGGLLAGDDVGSGVA